MSEPRLISAAFREPIEGDLEIECVFDDGTRGVFVTIAEDYSMLAESILLHLQCLAEDVR